MNNTVDFKINGNKKLSGRVKTNTSKNGAMGLMCASLVNQGKTILHGIPRIEEVYRMIEIMQSINIKVDWIDKRSLQIIPTKKLDLNNINKTSATRTRSIIMFIGSLVGYFKDFKLPHSQGCELGKRTIAAHIYGLQELGVKVKVRHDSYQINYHKLKANKVSMYESGDTACINMLLVASMIKGQTVIKFASSNYQVREVGYFLQKLGVKIKGLDTTTFVIEGLPDINQEIEYTNSEDPIESMMFISAAITTGSELTIERCPIDFLDLELYKLKKMGLKYKTSKQYLSYNQKTALTDITVYPSKLKALNEKIYARSYPGINIDNLPFFVPIATQSEGSTLIHDWTYENRAIYFMELAKLGADMILADPHRVYIKGQKDLRPAQVVCPPALRPAMIILIAMLAAEGVSILRNVYSISRGYEEIATRLNNLGADIQVL